MIGRLILAAIVLLAFGVEAAMGFGCNVLALTLGVHLYPLEQLLPVLVGLNLVVSLYIVVRHRAAIAWPVLLRRVLPPMLLGMPLGMLLFRLGSSAALERGFGLFVAALAGIELLAARAPVALPARSGALVLLAGGLMHGLYASGGPMAVYYASRQLPDKGHFRSTLSVLWLLLNAVLIGSYLFGGKLGQGTAELIALNLPALCAGIWCGEWLHGRLPQTAFRRIVLVLLLAGGLVLLVAGGR